MSRLIDFLTFKDQASADRPAPLTRPDDLPRKAERDAAILADKYPLQGQDIESVSEYRLASLMQYPHF